jgi:heme-degrading monooxygenase HmoA
MLAIIYRWRLHAGREDDFRAAWAEMTESIRVRWGTRGSRLHRNAEGELVAYAVWPSRERWSEARGEPSANPAAGEAMRACIAESFPSMVLDVVDDRLA